MALKLEKTIGELDTVTGEYWSIARISENKYGSQVVDLVITLHESAAAKDAGAEPLHIIVKSIPEYNMDIAALDQAGNNPYKLMYDYLKTLPYFVGAVDA